MTTFNQQKYRVIPWDFFYGKPVKDEPIIFSDDLDLIKQKAKEIASQWCEDEKPVFESVDDVFIDTASWGKLQMVCEVTGDSDFGAVILENLYQ
jgi:hypothetical protein